MRAQDLPNFKDMPLVKGMPHGTAWGLWDKDGERDSCGSLNLLTPENTVQAKQEIKSGTGVALKSESPIQIYQRTSPLTSPSWKHECIHHPGFSREEPRHEFKDLGEYGFTAFDDVISINTQSGSQWDGFRHWGHQDTHLYYNGLQHSEIPDPAHAEKNGIHQWSRRGGIVGRAVLIDYASYAEKHGINYSVTSRHEITIGDVEKIAKEQGVEFKPCDILIIRSGFVKWYNNAGDEERISGAKNGHEFAGLAGNEESVEWLWNHHFAAVAGDSITFEAWPPKAPYRLHDHFLAMWGTPIGELWNLEELAEACKKEKKYSFFLTSAPLNVHGGIASPPNALAIL
ncbi:putative cyclase-domain-containing protein [Amylocarpus encephaloides]|uniref:Cyclase-domain-containing protein n=1 Tax=Amylocarpus encephaloides TaxID=45428 RepID=A0A9P7YKS6_9HELO|nr:putative cyclase-domain-containing protein [Amylocarpus encephaloides]